MSGPLPESLIVVRFMDPEAQTELRDEIVEKADIDPEAPAVSYLAKGMASFQTVREAQFAKMVRTPDSRLAGLSTDQNLHILEQLVRKDPTAVQAFEAIPVTKMIIHPVSLFSMVAFYELEAPPELLREQVRLNRAMAKLNGTRPGLGSVSRRVAVASIASNDPKRPEIVQALRDAQPARITLMGAKAMEAASLYADN